MNLRNNTGKGVYTTKLEPEQTDMAYWDEERGKKKNQKKLGERGEIEYSEKRRNRVG